MTSAKVRPPAGCRCLLFPDKRSSIVSVKYATSFPSTQSAGALQGVLVTKISSRGIPPPDLIPSGVLLMVLSIALSFPYTPISCINLPVPSGSCMRGATCLDHNSEESFKYLSVEFIPSRVKNIDSIPISSFLPIVLITLP